VQKVGSTPLLLAHGNKKMQFNIPFLHYVFPQWKTKMAKLEKINWYDI